MSVDRKPISEFRKLMVSPQWPTPAEVEALRLAPNTLIFRDLATGEIAAIMDAEDLFDTTGTRFWLDA